MKTKWTRFNKVLFVLSFICGFIFVIILTVNVSKLDDGYGTLTFMFGSLGVIAGHAVWGLLIEISENILSIDNPNIAADRQENNTWHCLKCGM